MRWLGRLLFTGRHSFQVVVGIPLVMGLFIGWPYLLSFMGQDSATFGIGMFEPLVIALMYVMVASTMSLIGSKVIDNWFTNPIGKCDTSFLLFLCYFWGMLLLISILLLGGRSPA